MTVFCIFERQGWVHVTVVPYVSAAILLQLTAKKVCRGSVVKADRCATYGSPMFGGHRRLKMGKVYINVLNEPWSWSKERLNKLRGVSKTRFPMNFKELDFRYNHRDENLFDLITDYR